MLKAYWPKLILQQRDLKAAQLLGSSRLCCLCFILEGKLIKLRSDTMTVTCILLSVGKKVCLHNLVLEIFKLCFQNGIQLHTEWVLRTPNQIQMQFRMILIKIALC